MVIGQHLVLDLFGVTEKSFHKISKNHFEKIVHPKFLEVFKSNNLETISYNIYFYEHAGNFTVSYILSEGHFYMHAWPSKSFIAMDLFISGKEHDSKKILGEIKEFFDYDKEKNMYLKRGIR